MDTARYSKVSRFVEAFHDRPRFSSLITPEHTFLAR